MKIIIKILKHSSFTIELDSVKKTVQDLKNEIEKTQGFDTTQAKFLLGGKMLENSKTLEECKIKDGNTIIVMNAKPKGNAQTVPKVVPKKEPEKKEEPKKREEPKKNEVFEKREELEKKEEPVKKEEPKRIEIPVKKEEPEKKEEPVKKEEPRRIEIPVKKEEPKKKEEPEKKEEPKMNEEPEKKEEQPKQVKLQSKDTNSEYSNQINTLVDMGYETEEVEKAINAAKGNINLAIEYLNSDGEYLNVEVPEPSPQIQSQNQNLNQNQNQQTQRRHLSLELKRHASFIKCICKDDPKRVLALLNYIKHRNPVLMDKIKEFEKEFKDYLVSPLSQEDIDSFNLIENNYRELFEGRNGGVPEQIEVHLTEEDVEAIKRLKELGRFSDEDVIKAYIGCNRNEELAANYLFEMNMMKEGQN